MANYSVNPAALTFNKVLVRGPVAGLYPTAQVLSFVFKNTSGASVTITDWGFSNTTEGDAVTQPNGIYKDTDFTIAVTAGSFPVTVANSATQQFDVTYAPIRRGTGFGDVRSALIVLFAGNKALSNGGQVINVDGEVTDNQVPKLLIIGVGGGVIEEAFDNVRVHPMYWDAGAMPVGMDGEVSGSRGMSPVSTIADMDTKEHSSPMMFFAADQTTNATSVPFAAAPATYTTGSTSVPYAIQTPAVNASPRGGRGYQILIFWKTKNQTFNLTVQANTSAGWVTVASYTGLTPLNSGGLFIGNQEGLDLQGLNLRVTTAGGTYDSATYNIGAVITG